MNVTDFYAIRGVKRDSDLREAPVINWMNDTLRGRMTRNSPAVTPLP
jgi:hypothetical protein